MLTSNPHPKEQTCPRGFYYNQSLCVVLEQQYKGVRVQKAKCIGHTLDPEQGNLIVYILKKGAKKSEFPFQNGNSLFVLKLIVQSSLITENPSLCNRYPLTGKEKKLVTLNAYILVKENKIQEFIEAVEKKSFYEEIGLYGNIVYVKVCTRSEKKQAFNEYKSLYYDSLLPRHKTDYVFGACTARAPENKMGMSKFWVQDDHDAASSGEENYVDPWCLDEFSLPRGAKILPPKSYDKERVIKQLRTEEANLELLKAPPLSAKTSVRAKATHLGNQPEVPPPLPPKNYDRRAMSLKLNVEPPEVDSNSSVESSPEAECCPIQVLKPSFVSGYKAKRRQTRVLQKGILPFIKEEECCDSGVKLRDPDKKSGILTRREKLLQAFNKDIEEDAQSVMSIIDLTKRCSVEIKNIVIEAARASSAQNNSAVSQKQ